MKEVEWANRRAVGERSRSLVAEALRGYHGQFFRDQETGDWTWENLYRWIDALELNALSERLTLLDRHLHENEDEDNLARAENTLREWFTGYGYVVTCVEQITRHTSYQTVRCVVAVKRPGEKPVEIARTDKWADAIETAKAWLQGEHPMHKPMPRDPPEALFDTDLPEGSMSTSSEASPEDESPKE